jgi:hypothetical protein
VSCSSCRCQSPVSVRAQGVCRRFSILRGFGSKHRLHLGCSGLGYSSSLFVISNSAMPPPGSFSLCRQFGCSLHRACCQFFTPTDFRSCFLHSSSEWPLHKSSPSVLLWPSAYVQFLVLVDTLSFVGSYLVKICYRLKLV